MLPIRRSDPGRIGARPRRARRRSLRRLLGGVLAALAVALAPPTLAAAPPAPAGAPPDASYARPANPKLSTAAYPIVVVVDDGNGYRSIYVHLSRALVTKGDHVEAGQRIGREGATGNATGCHLHYGLIRMDGAWLPVAPDLVERWRYPISGRERLDPLRRLSLFGTGAAR